jgi:hypothetical protein
MMNPVLKIPQLQSRCNPSSRSMLIRRGEEALRQASILPEPGMLAVSLSFLGAQVKTKVQVIVTAAALIARSPG